MILIKIVNKKLVKNSQKLLSAFATIVGKQFIEEVKFLEQFKTRKFQKS